MNLLWPRWAKLAASVPANELSPRKLCLVYRTVNLMYEQEQRRRDAIFANKAWALHRERELYND